MESRGAAGASGLLQYGQELQRQPGKFQRVAGIADQPAVLAVRRSVRADRFEKLRLSPAVVHMQRQHAPQEPAAPVQPLHIAGQFRRGGDAGQGDHERSLLHLARPRRDRVGRVERLLVGHEPQFTDCGDGPLQVGQRLAFERRILQGAGGVQQPFGAEEVAVVRVAGERLAARRAVAVQEHSVRRHHEEHPAAVGRADAFQPGADPAQHGADAPGVAETGVQMPGQCFEAAPLNPRIDRPAGTERRFRRTGVVPPVDYVEFGVEERAVAGPLQNRVERFGDDPPEGGGLFGARHRPAR